VQRERVLGTSLELQILAEGDDAARGAEAAALAEIERLEAVFNSYSAQSELRRWQETLGAPQRVSAELLHVLHAGERWREVTGDAFHPGTEALTRQWSLAAQRGTEPSETELRRLTVELSEPLWRVDAAGVSATRLRDIPINLNAIAKGFIVDRACERAVAQPGVRQVLLNLGGDLRVIGPKGVLVAIADPAQDADNAPPLARIRIANGAVATSGGYRRGVQVGERWHSHLLDARTGRPVEHVASASVVADTAMDADVLATAFSVLHPDESLALAASLPGVACLLVSRTGELLYSERWAALQVT
jgi:thiamine biosynthesis lipoprotein